MPGAVYSPEEMLPPVADQVRAILLDPLTVAEKCCEQPVNSHDHPGEIDTATGALTVTVAEADLVVSATLVAITV